MSIEEEIARIAINVDAPLSQSWLAFQGGENHREYVRRLSRALMPVVKRALERAFEAGWMSSGEGYNGEYPDEGVPWEASAGREAYERWTKEAAR